MLMIVHGRSQLIKFLFSCIVVWIIFLQLLLKVSVCPSSRCVNQISWLQTVGSWVLRQYGWCSWNLLLLWQNIRIKMVTLFQMVIWIIHIGTLMFWSWSMVCILLRNIENTWACKLLLSLFEWVNLLWLVVQFVCCCKCWPMSTCAKSRFFKGRIIFGLFRISFFDIIP